MNANGLRMHHSVLMSLLMKLAFFTCVMLLPLSSTPMTVHAATWTGEGNSISRNGFTASTYSMVMLTPGKIRTGSVISCSPTPVAGSMMVMNRMTVGQYSGLEVYKSSAWCYNGTNQRSAAAYNEHYYSTNPGWADVISSGTAQMNLNGWNAIYAGHALGVFGSAAYASEVNQRVSVPTRVMNNDEYYMAQGENGLIGYIKENEESVPVLLDMTYDLHRFFEANEGTVHINVYAEDLVTPIDTYPVTYSVSR